MVDTCCKSEANTCDVYLNKNPNGVKKVDISSKLNNNMRYQEIVERTEDEVSSDEISLAIMSLQNLIARYRRSQRKAADIYHDIQMKGQLIDWLQEHFVPIWEKYGYPEIGKPAWGQVEQDFISKYLLD